MTEEQLRKHFVEVVLAAARWKKTYETETKPQWDLAIKHAHVDADKARKTASSKTQAAEASAAKARALELTVASLNGVMES